MSWCTLYCLLPSSCNLNVRKERRKLDFKMLVQQNVLLFLTIGLIQVSLIASSVISTNNLNATSNNIRAEPDYKEYAKVARYLVHKSGK